MTIITFIIGVLCGTVLGAFCFAILSNNKIDECAPVVDGTKEIVYISGKMRDMDERESRHLFWVAEQELKDKGYAVINPWSLEDKHRDCNCWADFIMDDLRIIHQYADCLYMLNNWRDSAGATTEHDFAKGDGIRIFYQESNKD